MDEHPVAEPNQTQKSMAQKAAPLLIIGPVPPPRGGISIHIQRLSRTFLERNIGSQILDESRTVTEGVPNLRRISPLGYLRLMYRAKVVHVHSSNRYVRLFHTIAARFLGARVLQTIHSHSEAPVHKACLWLACWLSHERIVVSEAIAREMSIATVVIPAYVNPGPEDEIIPEDVDDWLGQQRETGRKMIAMNAFRPTRVNGVDLYGLDMLIDVFERPGIREKFSAIACVADIDQDRTYFDELKQRIKVLDLEDQIFLRTGQIDFSGVLKQSDLFVRPTITDGDAVSIREAFWYGIPVLASDAVSRPKGTAIFKSRDVDDFATCILSGGTPKDQVSDGQNFAARVAEICESLLEQKLKKRQSRAPIAGQ